MSDPSTDEFRDHSDSMLMVGTGVGHDFIVQTWFLIQLDLIQLEGIYAHMSVVRYLCLVRKKVWVLVL